MESAESRLRRIRSVMNEVELGLISTTVGLVAIQGIVSDRDKSSAMFDTYKDVISMYLKNGKPDITGFIDRIYLQYPSDVKILRPGKSPGMRNAYYSWNTAHTIYKDPVGNKLATLRKWIASHFIYLYETNHVSGRYYLR